MHPITIEPLAAEHESEFLKFADHAIGKDYFDSQEFKEILNLSSDQQGHNASFVITHQQDHSIHGLRVCYLPGRWLQSFGPERCMTSAWRADPEKVGYFKSLFLSESLRGQGLGPQLSRQAIDVLKSLGAEAIVTHSWKESPQNSSQRYLEHFGFKKVGEHPLFWSHIDYHCTRCGRPPCQCTAVEMIYYLQS